MFFYEDSIIRNIRQPPPGVYRLLCFKNLPLNVTIDNLELILIRFGLVREIRLGDTPGTAYVWFADVFEAQEARERLNGSNAWYEGLVVEYVYPYDLLPLQTLQTDADKKQEELSKSVTCKPSLNKT